MRPPPGLGPVGTKWTDGWYLELREPFGPTTELLSGSSDGQLWTMSDSGISVMWDLLDESFYLIEKTARATIAANSEIVVGAATDCALETLGDCGSTKGNHLMDLSTGETFPVGGGNLPLLSADGGAAWFDNPAIGPDSSRVDWISGSSTDLVSLPEKLNIVDDRLTFPRGVAVSPDGGSVVFIPSPDENGKVSAQLAVVIDTGEILTLLPLGDDSFTGGASFSADGNTIMFGTSAGLMTFDIAARRASTEPITCDGAATWIRRPADVIEVSPGRWAVALTPPSLAGSEDLVAAIVDTSTGDCDVFATIASPSPDTATTIFFDLAGGSSASVIGLSLADFSVGDINRFPGGDYNRSILVDLSKRPAGAELRYVAGLWAVAA